MAEITRQPGLRKIQLMDTRITKPLAMLALLLGTGAALGQQAPAPATGPLGQPGAQSGARPFMPWGSGYESRGLGSSSRQLSETATVSVSADVESAPAQNTSANKGAGSGGGSGGNRGGSSGGGRR